MSKKKHINATNKTPKKNSKRMGTNFSAETERVAKLYLLPRQERLLEIMRKKGDLGVKMSKKDLLLEAGYSKYTARKPAQVFGGTSFREIFSSFISDKALIETHNELLSASKPQDLTFPLTMKDEEIERILIATGGILHHIAVTEECKIAYVTRSDLKVIIKALDLAYKIKGLFDVGSEKKAP